VRAEDPDILLLATHQGFRTFGDDHANEVNAIAREFPDFDAILGGHSHQPVERALVGGQMLFTQAGYYGIWLGQLDLTYDTVARKVVQKQARLHRVDEQVPRQPELEALVREDLDRAEAYLGERVGSGRQPDPVRDRRLRAFSRPDPDLPRHRGGQRRGDRPARSAG
jgi:2',3'-cyclic-nucleotide 2'-phosphodiesterase (5'-nucleotidase family)